MLTLFVGTLTDYFRAGFPKQNRPDRDDLKSRVEDWRSFIGDGLVQAGHLARGFDWSEEPQEAFTHLLTVEALQALRLLLVHGSGSEEAPALLPLDFESHPRWIAATSNDFEDAGAFDQLLVPELWFPRADFDFTFECPYPDGHEAHAGSTSALRRQLSEVDRTRMPSTSAQREAWRAEVPANTRDLETLARYGFAAFDAAVSEAERRVLPLLLHW